MKKFICTQKCPELDIDNAYHCTTGGENFDYCPCGNIPKWEEILKKMKVEGVKK